MEAPMKICSSVLFLAALLFAIPAHADTTDLTITGQTDFAACAAVEDGCSTVTFSLLAVTQFNPLEGLITDGQYDVLSVTGNVNGLTVTGGGGSLLNGGLWLPYSEIPITIDGVPSVITFYFADNFIELDGALVDWNVNVATPEPPTCLLLLLALPLLLKYRNRSLRGSCDA
jgi:hypothetical protein